MKSGIEDLMGYIEGMSREMEFFKKLTGEPNFPEVLPEWQGDINIGYDEVGGLAFGFMDDYPKNIIIIGKPGHGKSYLVLHMSNQARERGKILVFIETKKKAYGTALSQMRDDVLVLSYENGTIKTNFLEAPTGVSQHEWSQTWSSNLSQAEDMPLASGTSHFISTCERELREIGGSRKPNLLDLRDYINKGKKILRMSPDFKYMEVANNRLPDICDVLKDSIDVSDGFSFRQLITSPYIKVIECSDRPDLFKLEATDFIFRTLKFQESLPAQERRDIIFVLDEAHHLAGPEQEAVGRLGLLSNLFSYMSHGREYRVSFWIISQDIKRIHPSVPSLSHISCMFCSDGDTYHQMGVYSLGLTYAQKDFLLNHGLAPRQVVVKTDMAPAVILKVPDISHMFRNIDFEKAKEINKSRLEEFKFKPRDPEIMRLILAQSDKRDDDEKLLFMQICKNPEDSKTEHQKKLGMTTTRFGNVVSKLITQGLLNSVELQIGGSGRPRQLLELTKRGCEEVLKLGLKPPKTGKGGLKHDVYIKTIEQAFHEKGYQTKREYFFPGPGIYVDILVWNEKESFAVEVELSDAGRLVERLACLLEANLVTKILAFSDCADTIAKSKRLLNREEITYQTCQEFFRQRRKN